MCHNHLRMLSNQISDHNLKVLNLHISSSYILVIKIIDLSGRCYFRLKFCVRMFLCFDKFAKLFI